MLGENYKCLVLDIVYTILYTVYHDYQYEGENFGVYQAT